MPPLLVLSNPFGLHGKRESGASPEQTRCCESHRMFRQTLLPLPFGVGRLSENRDKSENLPMTNKKLTLSWGEAENMKDDKVYILNFQKQHEKTGLLKSTNFLNIYFYEDQSFIIMHFGIVAFFM